MHGIVGSRLNVAFGGGKRHFLPNTVSGGMRSDGKNLINEFMAKNSDGKVLYARVSFCRV